MKNYVYQIVCINPTDKLSVESGNKALHLLAQTGYEMRFNYNEIKDAGIIIYHLRKQLKW